MSQGGKYEIFEEDGSAHLEIYEAEVSDSGAYECTAKNSDGSVTTRCTVTVKGEFVPVNRMLALLKIISLVLMQSNVILKNCVIFSESRKSTAFAAEAKSEITEELISKKTIHGEVQSFTEIKALQTQMTMTEGQTATLKANIPGAADVKWILNGVELINSEQYRYGISGNYHTLTIKSVSANDRGIVTCEAKTEQGVFKCQFSTSVSEKLSNAPCFLVQPRSQNINEGQDVILSCEIMGEPAPEIEWLKDNEVVSKINGLNFSSLF